MADEWWRSAVVYQIYPRSFADSDGDGFGDLAGIRSRLPYLRDLGVDALWINPWYLSPQSDGGYDVADYRRIDPVLGDLAGAEELIAAAHDAGLRVVVDVVPNHVSIEHPWFRAAVAAGPGSPERARFHVRRGRGEHGELPPNDWRSAFGGPAWTRLPSSDGAPQEWYLRLFSPGQPDLNWSNDEVHAELEAVLRFWFDRGVDGFRVDMAHALAKDPDLRDLGPLATEDVLAPPMQPDHPYLDRDEVHDVYRAWRRLAEGYGPDRWFLAEAWSDPSRAERLDNYLRPDELHSAFAFDYLGSPWRSSWFRRAIDRTLATFANVGSRPTWALSNHDLVRHLSRYGRPQPDHAVWSMEMLGPPPTDVGLGLRRARAAALMTLALPGPVVVYQGEELGLPEVEDLPHDARRDPIAAQSEVGTHSRDGCRVPLPWSGTASPYGFSPADASAAPWLPQPDAWAGLTVERQAGDPGSVLELYRAALALRRTHSLGASEGLEWLPSDDDVLAFGRGDGFRCLVNLGTAPAALPSGTVLLASSPLEDGTLPPDTAVWLAGD